MSVDPRTVDVKSNSSVNDAVEALIASRPKGMSLSSQTVEKLRSNPNAYEIINAFYRTVGSINKIANIIIQKINNRLETGSNSKTPQNYISVAELYAKKNNFTKGETDYLVELIKNNLSKNVELSQAEAPSDVPQYNKMRHTLGSFQSLESGSMVVSDADKPHLERILQLCTVTKNLHSNVVLQHLMFNEDTPVVTGMRYDPLKHSILGYVHPVVAALFLIKQQSLEQMFLLSNIAHIVKCRYEGKNVLTLPDFLLCHALMNDPIDVLCNDNSVQDLLVRAETQECLWMCVFHLRNGNCYYPMGGQLLQKIALCTLNKSETPDCHCDTDEGVMVRKLFHMLSYKPLAVSTSPINFSIAQLQGANVAFPVYLNRLTAVSMITVRLPLVQGVRANGNPAQRPFLLSEMKNTPQYFYEHGSLVPKMQHIVYSKGLIPFHIVRRVQGNKYVNMITNPAAIIGGYPSNNYMNQSLKTHLNMYPVELEYHLTINSQYIQGYEKTYDLRSVLTLKTIARDDVILRVGDPNPVVPPVDVSGIVLCEACFPTVDRNGNESRLREDGNFDVYDPVSATLSTNGVNQPYRQNENYADKVTHYGTVFIYGELNCPERLA